MPQVLIIQLTAGVECLICNVYGKHETNKHEYPHHAKEVPNGSLRHTFYCPMNECLNEDGTLKEDVTDQKAGDHG
jgi:hypothetical protein